MPGIVLRLHMNFSLDLHDSTMSLGTILISILQMRKLRFSVVKVTQTMMEEPGSPAPRLKLLNTNSFFPCLHKLCLRRNMGLVRAGTQVLLGTPSVGAGFLQTGSGGLHL